MENNKQKSVNSRRCKIFWRRNWALLSTAAAFLLLFIYAQYIEPDSLRVTEWDFSCVKVSPELDGLRIVFIADLHVKEKNLDHLQKTINTINALDADLILLGGDFVNGNGSGLECDQVVKQLEQLTAGLGIYAVPGNHDYRYDIEKLRHAFADSRIKLLQDTVIPLNTAQGGRLNLIGLDYQLNPHRRRNLNRLQNKFSEEALNIVLTHTPADFEYLPEQADLTLAGHTHGGQLHLPGLGSVINPAVYGRNLSYGAKYSGSKAMFITAGLSSAYTRARFCMKPEIVLITLKSPYKNTK